MNALKPSRSTTAAKERAQGRFEGGSEGPSRRRLRKLADDFVSETRSIPGFKRSPMRLQACLKHDSRASLSFVDALPQPLPIFTRSTSEAVTTLVVRRFEDGRWVRAPRTFQASELSDRHAVGHLYGGGKYEVIGRDRLRIRARSTFTLEGPSLPLGESLGAATKPRRARDARNNVQEFSTPVGRREALVFELLDEGLELIDIAKRTAIEARTLRGIYEEWRALHALREPIGLQLRERSDARGTALDREWGTSWTSGT
jgi:hypothetical protein